MDMSAPQMPPRPTRSNHHHSAPLAAANIPQIPPRPEKRRVLERSQSPNRELFARSPLNEPPATVNFTDVSNGFQGNDDASQSGSNSELPQRPPSVSLPSIGQEGNEYADIEYSAETLEPKRKGSVSEPQETRNVSHDLPLHAPKPSFSDSTAKQRVSAVTRTDSNSAAAVGIGKAPTPADDKDPHDRVLRSKVSFRASSAASTERPQSTQQDDEQGIPEIGQRVPMYPNAGDVQAPSPSPFQASFPAGIGFHNSGIPKAHRHHRRTPSGKEVCPPGSYGMHGHGLPSNDQFEKTWYEKHPDALEREEGGQYGPGLGSERHEWALSSDDLNKLVHESSRPSTQVPGLPSEQIGYMALEEQQEQMTPAPSYKPLHPNHSQPHVESPLRKASFPEERQKAAEQKEVPYSPRLSSEDALESETEDDDDDDQSMSRSKSITKQVIRNQLESSGEERGHEFPILAADEVARAPVTEFQQAAVSPTQSRRGSAMYEGDLLHKIGSQTGSASNSRPTSRPGSLYGGMHSMPGLSRFSTHDDERENMHTPLEDVDEYEPLFTEDETTKERRPMTVAERLKLREQMKRFPSRDIWEDTPNSLQLEATVQTPELAEKQADPGQTASANVFETPEQEKARKGEFTEDEKAELLPKEERLKKSHFKPHLREEINRPGMSQRFPSKDIWEDSPDSVYLETTVGDSPSQDSKSPTDEGLDAGAIVKTSGAPKEGVLSGSQSRDNATVGTAAMKPSVPPRPNKNKVTPETIDVDMQSPPSVPARPPKRVHQVPPADARAPIPPSKLSETSPVEGKVSSPLESRNDSTLPGRKPQVPARPARKTEIDTVEGVVLSKVQSASSAGSDGASEQTRDLKSPPPAPKPKPAVPARPVGGKISSVKAGFLSDLESRLKVGPQSSKPHEKAVESVAEEEKAPLEDARKGRARGPARRKPAAPSDKSFEEDLLTKKTAQTWQIQQPWTIWQHDGELKIGSGTPITLTKDNLESVEVPPATSTEKAPSTEIPESERLNIANKSETKPVPALTSVEAGDAPSPGSLLLPRPGEELARNPLSKGASPTSSSPATVISPDSYIVQTNTGDEEISNTQAIVEGEKSVADTDVVARDNAEDSEAMEIIR